jgi:hypothetical protein
MGTPLLPEMSDATQPTCIYCRRSLDEHTDTAHVWPKALGGRLASKRFCCNDCNHELSRVEDDLCSALRRINAAMGATRADGSKITYEMTVEGLVVRVCGALFDVQVPGLSYDPSTKTLEIPLPAGYKRQVEVIAQAMRRQRLKPDDVDKLELVPARDPELPPSGRYEFDFSVGRGASHKRAFAKIALELLAFHRHALATRAELAELRQFTRHGSGSLQSKPDGRSEGSGLLAGRNFPDIWNSVEIWSCGKSLFFRIVFVRYFSFTGSLTTEWQGPSFRAAYAFNARDPSERIVDECVDGDGPRLSLWHNSIREETIDQSVQGIWEESLRLASASGVPRREEPPPLDQLRADVRKRLLSLPSPKSRRKPRP